MKLRLLLVVIVIAIIATPFWRSEIAGLIGQSPFVEFVLNNLRSSLEDLLKGNGSDVSDLFYTSWDTTTVHPGGTPVGEAVLISHRLLSNHQLTLAFSTHLARLPTPDAGPSTHRLFHCTSREALASIEEVGFDLSFADLDYNFLGPAIYFTPSTSECHLYSVGFKCPHDPTLECYDTLLSDVAVGKQCIADVAFTGPRPDPTCDSYRGVAGHTDTGDGAKLSADEQAVYDNAAARPAAIITYTVGRPWTGK